MSSMLNAAVFSCLGLGDGLLSLILSHNFHLNGWKTTTYHPFLRVMQSWFPHLPIEDLPPEGFDLSLLSGYDKIFLFYERSPWMEAILRTCLELYPAKTTVLNPIATPHCDYPYWEGGRFNGNRCMVDNLYTFCKEVLHLRGAVRTNGIRVPPMEQLPQEQKRVILHPTSSRPGKNWPREKFLSLAARLQGEGFDPVFILKADEREGWERVQAPPFTSLLEIAAYVQSSAFMIGNDSGIGHLASCLGVPTVTICRSRMSANFWRPGWASGEIVYPPSWVPNLKGLRLRDQHWQWWVSVKSVFRAFQQLSLSEKNIAQSDIGRYSDP